MNVTLRASSIALRAAVLLPLASPRDAEREQPTCPARSESPIRSCLSIVFFEQRGLASSRRPSDGGDQPAAARHVCEQPAGGA